jgi:dTMP kinase
MSAIKNTCNAPLFISFEGIEGMGKSTQIQLLYDYLITQNIPVIKTREPGGTPLGEDLRSCLLRSYDCSIDALTELALLVAARHHHLRCVIEPALEKGSIVLCDRFTDASRAYQGYGRGLGLSLVDNIHQNFGIVRDPDLTILLDGPAELSSDRRLHRAQKSDRIEEESLSFFEKVRSGYREIASNNPERFVVMNALLDRQVLARDIAQIVSTRISF